MDREAMQRYLDRVEGHLAGSGKADIVREIESHILDRAEALAAARGGEVTDEDLARAMEELGEPSELAVSYSGEKHIVSPKEYASFWYFTLLLFGVHLAMLLLAVVTKTRFGFFPFNVLPVSQLEGAGAILVVVSLAVQAFLFDAGLVLVVFFLLRRTFRKVELPNLTFRVETSRRQSLFRAAFTAAMIVLFGVSKVRDNLFTIRLGKEAPPDIYSLFLPGYGEVLPFILSFLALSLVKDLLYAFFHERTWTVAMDVLTWVAGVALCVLLFAQPGFIGLPADFPLDAERIELFNNAMAHVLGLFFIVLAAIFAARAVKRFVRFRQLWGEQDPERL